MVNWPYISRESFYVITFHQKSFFQSAKDKEIKFKVTVTKFTMFNIWFMCTQILQKTKFLANSWHTKIRHFFMYRLI